MTFCKEFGKNIKLGIIENPGNRSKLAKKKKKLSRRYYSSRNMIEVTWLRLVNDPCVIVSTEPGASANLENSEGLGLS